MNQNILIIIMSLRSDLVLLETSLFVLLLWSHVDGVTTPTSLALTGVPAPSCSLWLIL